LTQSSNAADRSKHHGARIGEFTGLAQRREHRADLQQRFFQELAGCGEHNQSEPITRKGVIPEDLNFNGV